LQRHAARLDEGLTHCRKPAEIGRWHVEERGWRDIGYRWVIDRDGAIAPGRAETVIGAPVQGHNAGTLGVCLLGGLGASADDHFVDHFTGAQDRELRSPIDRIKARTAIATVSGHNECATKACRGFSVWGWF